MKKKEKENIKKVTKDSKKGKQKDVIKNISIIDCRPKDTDYTFMWWAYGWRSRSPENQRVLCFQSGNYGFALDVGKLKLLNFGTISNPKPACESVSQDNDVIFNLPKSDLELFIFVEEKKYSCVSGAPKQDDVRLIDCGRFVQRWDILGLVFEDEQKNKLNAKCRLEIVAFPENMTIILEVIPEENLSEVSMEINLFCCRKKFINKKLLSENIWEKDNKQIISISLEPTADKSVVDITDENSIIVENMNYKNEKIKTNFDNVYGWYYIDLPKEDWKVEDDLDHLDRVIVKLKNPKDTEQVFRLLFAKDYGFIGHTGLCPIIRDLDGNPTGIPVQLSKNWHASPTQYPLYQGPWFHGFAILRLPPKSSIEFEFNIIYARWGGVPAASHAQLCLIGWGTNQLWDQVAIGSFGESICYDPDVNLGRSIIDDVRPLMVWAMNNERKKWNWTNNVGGGDFLVYFNDKGQKQFLSRMRTHYECYGPNLTKVTYSGISPDGNIAATIRVSTPRCDDINRAYHYFRYDVLKSTPFTRLAFYQVGSDQYNDHQFNMMARGNGDGLIEEWEPNKGGFLYDRTGIKCEGDVMWFSLHQAINKDTKGGAWANRGLVVRKWKARLGGKDIPAPYASVFRTQDWLPSANLELSAPPNIKKLEPGDFVEGEVELIIMPISSDDYYGPNENLRQFLETNGNTWKPIYRQAIGNDIKLKAIKGKILHNYPIILEVDKNQIAEIEITDGIGYLPITFTGLNDYKDYELWQCINNSQKLVNQNVHGSDFWQTDFNPENRTWIITYNILLDTPNDKPHTTRFAFKKKE